MLDNLVGGQDSSWIGRRSTSQASRISRWRDRIPGRSKSKGGTLRSPTRRVILTKLSLRNLTRGVL